MSLNLWEQFYKKTPPVGYILRNKYPSLWLRIHSLQGSKMYAETKDDYAQLLIRNRTVATEILKEGAIFIFTSFYKASDSPSNLLNTWTKHLSFVNFKNYPIADEDDEPYSVYTFKVHFKWTSSLFDQVIVDIANENTAGPTLFFSEGSGNVYSPYCGGADLFIPNRFERAEMKKKFADWIRNS